MRRARRLGTKAKRERQVRTPSENDRCERRERRPSANAKRGNVLGSICLCCSLLDGTCLTRCRLGGLAIAHYIRRASAFPCCGFLMRPIPPPGLVASSLLEGSRSVPGLGYLFFFAAS